MCLVSCSFFYYLSQDWVDIIEYKKNSHKNPAAHFFLCSDYWKLRLGDGLTVIKILEATILFLKMNIWILWKATTKDKIQQQQLSIGNGQQSNKLQVNRMNEIY